MTTQYIKPSAIRKAVKAGGKRTSAEFLDALDRYVERAIARAIAAQMDEADIDPHAEVHADEIIA